MKSSEDIQRVRGSVAKVNSKAAEAVLRVPDEDHAYPAHELQSTHNSLADTFKQTLTALQATERAIHNVEDHQETPKEVIREHATRIKEQYDGPVLNLALMLLDANRREWLYEKRDLNGAAEVNRHGLTQNQRSWLNDLQDAWGQYDGE